MGRRWVVKLDTVEETIPPIGRNMVQATRQTSRYLGELALGHVRDEQGRLLPVTVSYATKFVTKRDALAAAEKAGHNLDEVETLRTWW